MNIKLSNYFTIKNFLGEKIKSSSLRFGRNNHNITKKNFLKQKLLSKQPIIKNILPKITRLNSLNETKNKKFISPNNKENINSYLINTNNKMFNIIPFRNSITQIQRNERIKLFNIRDKNKNKNPSYFTTIINNNKNQNNNSIMNESENKMKKIRKIINLYYTKNDERINHNITKEENTNNINILKEEENQNAYNAYNAYNKTINTKSMFMTEMNFLNNKKNKKIKNKETKEVKNNKTAEHQLKNTNYDFLNFKELLKRIEIDKKKIINNQNDIDEMIKTTKDTYNEIWKYNHH